MKFGNLNKFSIFFILFSINFSFATTEDKIQTVPLINLEELSPTFEEEKDELEKIEEKSITLNESENISEDSVSKKKEKLWIKLQQKRLQSD